MPYKESLNREEREREKGAAPLCVPNHHPIHAYFHQHTILHITNNPPTAYSLVHLTCIPLHHPPPLCLSLLVTVILRSSIQSRNIRGFDQHPPSLSLSSMSTANKHQRQCQPEENTRQEQKRTKRKNKNTKQASKVRQASKSKANKTKKAESPSQSHHHSTRDRLQAKYRKRAHTHAQSFKHFMLMLKAQATPRMLWSVSCKETAASQEEETRRNRTEMEGRIRAVV